MEIIPTPAIILCNVHINHTFFGSFILIVNFLTNIWGSIMSKHFFLYPIVMLAMYSISVAYYRSFTYEIGWVRRIFSDYSKGAPWEKVEASGLVIPVNYRPGDKFQFVNIECYQKKCRFVEGISGDNEVNLFVKTSVPDSTSYTDSKIVLTRRYQCRSESWVLDRVSQKAWLESTPLPVAQQTGDCSAMETDIRKAFLGDSGDLRQFLKGKR